MVTYLIGYVSKTGTTKEIAERIAGRMKDENIETEVLPLKEIHKTGHYSGVILGSPINGMKLLPEFHSFIRSHKTLKKEIIGFYTVSYIFEKGRKNWRAIIRKDVNKVRTQLDPGLTAIFGGRIDKKMPKIINILFGLPQDLPLDNRNWTQIDQWADAIISSIKG